MRHVLYLLLGLAILPLVIVRNIIVYLINIGENFVKAYTWNKEKPLKVRYF